MFSTYLALNVKILNSLIFKLILKLYCTQAQSFLITNSFEDWQA